ncbi:MAG: CocE/NonD family hydrolase [Bryobacterales bacterium]|nr:CocE/NonD family hydrolase [Bryobacterales bacterium]
MVYRLLLPLLLAGSLFAQNFKVLVDRNQKVKMRDGILLATDVYRPDSSESFPVLVERTPYSREGCGDCKVIASRGYIVVIQDTRGRFDSKGQFYPFRDEANDGYDTVEWAAALPRSNGKVGMFGGSYVGATQLLATLARPPHLLATLPYLTSGDYHAAWTYQSGALMQWFASSWSTLLVTDTVRRAVGASGDAAAWVRTVPLSDYPMFAVPPARALAPYYFDWLEHETDDQYWKRWSLKGHYAGLAIKSLSAGGWHDIFLKGTIDNYTGMRSESDARGSQRLIVGPWGHAGTSKEGKIGDVTFGPDAVLDMTRTTTDWFDFALKGMRNHFATDPPIRIFVMGTNQWRNEAEFPLPGTQTTAFYLSKDGLSRTRPGDEPPQSYEYDPRNPVPTIGGRLCCARGFDAGPADQSPNEKRADVLVFSTPPLERDLEATGWVKVKLYAATSAPDTDFTAMLTDVDPSGYSRLLTDGIVRARYRNSTEKAAAIIPGKVYAYDIDLWATGNVFKTGHRIRLAISSSNFPRFNRSFNTGEPIANATRMVKARQTVYHDPAHPSALLLPVIPARR